MKILVTGASGFVGRVFLKHLIRETKPDPIVELILIHHKTRISESLLKQLNQRGPVKLIQADLTQPWNFFPEVDVVLNLAADGSPSAYTDQSSQRYTDINNRFLDWTRATNIRKIIHVSSGICDYFDANKSDSIFLSPNKKHFASVRRNVETLIEEHSKQHRIVLKILRLYSFVGKELVNSDQYAIIDFIKSAINSKRIEVNGNSATLRTYLSEEDLGKVIYMAVTAPDFPDISSVASKHVVSMRMLAEFISARCGATVDYNGENEIVQSYVPIYAKRILPGDREVAKVWSDTIEEMINLMKRKENDCIKW